MCAYHLSIQTIALLLSEPRRKPSLVVAPVVALMQWKHEIETHAEGFTTYLFHGSNRVKAAELKKYDVVSVRPESVRVSAHRPRSSHRMERLKRPSAVSSVGSRRTTS